MVKGNGGEWENTHRRGHVDTAHNLVKCACHFSSFSFKWRGESLFYTTPQPTTLNVLCQYTFRILFLSPSPTPVRSTTLRHQCATHSHPHCRQVEYTRQRPHRGAAGRDSWGKCMSPSCGTKPQSTLLTYLPFSPDPFSTQSTRS